MRFVRAFCLVALLAGVFAGAAAALDFNDEGDNAPRGEVGKVYHFEMPSHGGCFYAPYRYVVESGQLPPGTKLGNASNLVGLVSGIPTESGTFGAWIALKDVCGSSAELLFTFDVWPRRWGISTDSLKPAVAGSQYSFTIEGKGVPSTVTWAVTGGALPAGITLSQDGKLAGTPTTGGAATFTVTGTAVGTDPAADGTRIDSRKFTLDVTEPLAIRISRRAAESGVPFRTALSGTGGRGPYAWAATGLPPGVALDESGQIGGVPTRPGTYPAQVTMTDANGNARTLELRLTVAPRLVIAARSLRSASVGSVYAAKLRIRGGVRPVTWTIVSGHLPVGLRLDPRTGMISGTPRAAGVARVKFKAKDAAGGSSIRVLVVLSVG